MKSGIIDGQENPLALTFNAGFFDANSNLALTEHMMQDNMIVVAEATFQKISEGQRKALVQASRDMEDAMRAKVIADDARILGLVKQEGTAINDIDKAALAGMDAEFPHVKKWVDRIAAIA